MSTGTGTQRPDSPGLLPRLHVLTDDTVLARTDFPRLGRAILERLPNGVALHVRGPRTSGRLLHDLARELLPSASSRALVVNDRVDVALALGMGAVHLGQRSIDVATARALLGPDSRIGVSVHDRAEAYDDHAAGADYWMIGPIFPTRSHPGVEGKGAEWIGVLAEAPGAVPVVAVGGISPDGVGVLLRRGVHGLAVLSGVWDASDPVAAAAGYAANIRGCTKRLE